MVFLIHIPANSSGEELHNWTICVTAEGCAALYLAWCMHCDGGTVFARCMHTYAKWFLLLMWPWGKSCRSSGERSINGVDQRKTHAFCSIRIGPHSALQSYNLASETWFEDTLVVCTHRFAWKISNKLLFQSEKWPKCYTKAVMTMPLPTETFDWYYRPYQLLVVSSSNWYYNPLFISWY
jgi:hypothetical protein